MSILNADFDVVFKKPVTTVHTEPKFNRLWDLLIPNQTYHVVGVCDETEGYILEFFDHEIIFEKEAFDEVP